MSLSIASDGDDHWQSTTSTKSGKTGGGSFRQHRKKVVSKRRPPGREKGVIQTLQSCSAQMSGVQSSCAHRLRKCRGSRSEKYIYKKDSYSTKPGTSAGPPPPPGLPLTPRLRDVSFLSRTRSLGQVVSQFPVLKGFPS